METVHDKNAGELSSPAEPPFMISNICSGVMFWKCDTIK